MCPGLPLNAGLEATFGEAIVSISVLTNRFAAQLRLAGISVR